MENQDDIKFSEACLDERKRQALLAEYYKHRRMAFWVFGFLVLGYILFFIFGEFIPDTKDSSYHLLAFLSLLILSLALHLDVKIKILRDKK